MDGGWAASHLCKRGGIPTPCVSIWACYGILLLHYAPRSRGQRDCLEGFFCPTVLEGPSQRNPHGIKLFLFLGEGLEVGTE